MSTKYAGRYLIMIHSLENTQRPLTKYYSFQLMEYGQIGLLGQVVPKHVVTVRVRGIAHVLNQ